MREKFRKMVALAWRYACPVLLVGLLGSLVLHFFIKDRFAWVGGKIWVVAFLFYALPIRVITLLAWVYLGVAWKQGRHRIRATFMVTTLTSYCVLSPSGFTGELSKPTLAFWNLEHGSPELSELADYVNKVDAEIYTFVECYEDLQRAFVDGRLEREVPGYRGFIIPGGMALLVREGAEAELIEIQKTDLYRFAKVEVDGVRICIVDIFSLPYLDRRTSLSALVEFVADCDFISGDFNTPYESVHFDLLKEGFTSGNTEHAMKRETWPAPLPVLSLDHIFAKKGREVIAYQMMKNWATDHYPVAIKLR